MKGIASIVATIILMSIMLVLIGITAFYFSNTTESVENAYQREGEIHEDIVGKTVRIKDL